MRGARDHALVRALGHWAGLASALVAALSSCGDTTEGGAEVVRVLPATAVAIAGGESDIIRFEVPDGALSVVISIAGDPDTAYGLGHWLQPDGVALVPDGWLAARQRTHPSLCLGCANRIALTRWTFAALAPNNPDVHLRPGTHELTVIALPAVDSDRIAGDGVVQVAVDVKLGPALPERGVLDVTLHFASAYWSAERAADAPVFQGIVDSARELLAQAGLELGHVRFVDAGLGVTAFEPELGAGTDLHALLAAGAPEGLDIYVVDRLETEGGAALRGLATGIPCGMFGPGTGIVLSLASTLRLEVTLAHELGHALGLFHTTEAGFGSAVPLVHDQLGDTAPSDPSLLLYHDLSGTRLTPEQATVMRSHPRVRHR